MPMMQQGRMLFAVVVPSLLSAAAGAQEKESLLSADQMQVESSKPLLLRKQAVTNRSGLDRSGVAAIVAAVEQARFDVKDGDFRSPEIAQWCMGSASEAAQRMGDVDTKGQARVSTEALQSRCSAVYAYTLSVGHSCSYESKKKQWACSASANVVITKASATVGSEGVPSLSGDGTFGGTGQVSISVDGNGSNKDIGSAQREAASSAAFSLERAIRDVPGFQLHGPLVDAQHSSASFCLGSDVLELDQPFHLVKVNEAGQRVDVGWGKVRSIHDGCVLTDAMQSRSPGRSTFDLQPARIETIIGRGDVRAGMSAIEMPSTGLNLGIQGGTTSAPGGSSAVGVGLVGEYDLARHTGASELYVFAHVGIVVPGSDARAEVIRQAGNVDTSGGSGGIFGAQGELGLLKRVYFGRPFFDFGAGLAGAWYNLPSVSNMDLNIVGYGAVVKAGLGMQVSPRAMLRVLGTGRFLALTSVLKDSSSSSSSSGETSTGSLDAESGVGVMAGFLYTL